MSKRSIRIGIDVGGTFTHAVAVELPGNKVIARAVTPTTHRAASSVSEGIITVFEEIIRKTGAGPAEINFVAHSTTQATNALLEGDVARVGIVGMGKGLESIRARSDTRIGNPELSRGKRLYTEHVYLSSLSKRFGPEGIAAALSALRERGAEVLVASEAFGVDNPEHEDLVVAQALEQGIPAVAGHEISQLYGLRVRTRTAVINAGILPKMTATAELTGESVRKSGITAPLMIMRSDGGVMDLARMKRRPILTMLSGPAAGIAAALMFVKISDGIFLETGGTSTDISAIKNGRAVIKTASVGGHITYLRTLDSRTVGIGGGSMVRMKGDTVAELGPRSAHIAGLGYLAFSPGEELADIKPVLFQPMEGDPGDYLAVINPAGKRFAVTLTDAAIVAGMAREGDYAFANREQVLRVFEILAGRFHTSPDRLAQDMLDRAADKVAPVVNALLEEYRLDRELVSLVGGGGGAAAVVPWMSRRMGMACRIAPMAEVISAIGAALAMLRDSVERTVVNPSEEDVLRIRREAAGRLEAMGAAPETIEVQVEVDRIRNLVRAIATGALPMNKERADMAPAEDEEIKQAAAVSFKASPGDVSEAAATTGFRVFRRSRKSAGWFGLFRYELSDYRVLDLYATVKLQINDGAIKESRVSRAPEDLRVFIEQQAAYNDTGMVIPEVFLLYRSRIADFSGILQFDPLLNLAEAELEGLPEDERVLIITHRRG